jgi:hypothetical protein
MEADGTDEGVGDECKWIEVKVRVRHKRRRNLIEDRARQAVRSQVFVATSGFDCFTSPSLHEHLK